VVDRHVLASVINVELAHVNTDIMLVGQSIRDFGNGRELGQDLLLHEVKSSLNRSRVILGKSVTSDLLDTGVDGLEIKVAENISILGDKGPLAVNSSGEDTIPDGSQGGVLIGVETVESRTSSLQDKEFIETGGDVDLVTSTVMVDGSSLDIFTVTDERVGVRLTVNDKTSPLVLDNVDKSTRKMSILLQDVGGDFLTEEFNVINVLATLGHDVDGVLAGI
jgi:hypothetical protein